MLKKILGGFLWLNFAVVACSFHVAAGDRPEIYPSSKYPDYPFSEAVAYGGYDLGMEDIIKCTVFLADISEWQTFNKSYVEHFEVGRFPARSALAASGLALGARVEVECMAALK